MSSAVQSVPVLSTFLDDLQRRVDGTIVSTINRGENAALDVEVEAGRQASMAIENAKIAYKESLDETIDKVNQTVKDSLALITSLVNDVENKNIKALSDFEKQVTQCILTLPFTGELPQLTKIHPRSIFVTKANPEALIKFFGVFKYAQEKNCTPVLELGGKKYTPISNTTQELGFNVALTAEATKRTFLMGKLTVPYEPSIGLVSKIFLGPLSSLATTNKVANFNVWIGVLPLTLGKITAHYYSVRSNQEISHVSTPSIQAWGDPHYPARSVDLQNIHHVENGWRILPNTVRIVDDGNAHGNHGNPSIRSVDGNQIVTVVNVAAFDGKHMGRVHYHLEYDREREVQITERRSEEVSLNWGDSTLLNPAPGEQVERIVFDSFDGHHNEYAGPTLENPYLKIRFEGGRYRLSAEPS